MRQNIGQFSFGSVAVMATLFATHGLLGNSAAKAESFNMRFAAVETVQKGDRLGAVAPQSEASVVFYNDPRAGLTIATKIGAAKPESSRAVPSEQEKQQKKKLLIGCEPSFSPVTTPSMANVVGRCMAARDGATKFAELAH